MKVSNAVLFTILLASSLNTIAENTNKIKTTSVSDSGLYSGGGIRGALPDNPDGWLVSPQEAIQFKGAQAFEEPGALRPRGVSPFIEVLKPLPAEDFKVKAPFSIAVKFKNLADADIVPSTFKVLYGTFKLDITSRLTSFVKVTKEGFHLDNAQIPTGKHRLILQVQDEKQRVAERELKVEVE